MNIESLARDAHHVMAILVSPNQRDILLVDVDAGLPDEETAALCSAGFFYAGAVGVVHGQPEIVVTEALPPDTLFTVGCSYRCHVQAQCGDSAKWLSDLHDLPDMRGDA